MKLARVAVGAPDVGQDSAVGGFPLTRRARAAIEARGPGKLIVRLVVCAGRTCAALCVRGRGACLRHILSRGAGTARGTGCLIVAIRVSAAGAGDAGSVGRQRAGGRFLLPRHTDRAGAARVAVKVILILVPAVTAGGTRGVGGGRPSIVDPVSWTARGMAGARGHGRPSLRLALVRIGRAIVDHRVDTRRARCFHVLSRRRRRTRGAGPPRERAGGLKLARGAAGTHNVGRDGAIGGFLLTRRARAAIEARGPGKLIVRLVVCAGRTCAALCVRGRGACLRHILSRGAGTARGTGCLIVAIRVSAAGAGDAGSVGRQRAGGRFLLPRHTDRAGAARVAVKVILILVPAVTAGGTRGVGGGRPSIVDPVSWTARGMAGARGHGRPSLRLALVRIGRAIVDHRVDTRRARCFHVLSRRRRRTRGAGPPRERAGGLKLARGAAGAHNVGRDGAIGGFLLPRRACAAREARSPCKRIGRLVVCAGRTCTALCVRGRGACLRHILSSGARTASDTSSFCIGICSSRTWGASRIA